MARVLAHAHSDWSYDGTLSLDEWRGLARQSGYDAVLFAEHEETGWNAGRYADYAAACAATSAPDVALIPGIEFNQQGFHIACYGLRRWPSNPVSYRPTPRKLRADGSGKVRRKRGTALHDV